MHIKEYIKKIVDDGKKENMECLSYMLDEAIHKVKECDYDWFCEKKMDLYVMAYGKVLNKEMAEEIIMDMQPYHMRWTLEETEAVRKAYDLGDVRDIDFWVVMNAKYNDNKDTVERFVPDDNEKQLEMYVSLAKDFIKDKDAKDGKVFTYFTSIPK